LVKEETGGMAGVGGVGDLLLLLLFLLLSEWLNEASYWRRGGEEWG